MANENQMPRPQRDIPYNPVEKIEREVPREPGKTRKNPIQRKIKS